MATPKDDDGVLSDEETAPLLEESHSGPLPLASGGSFSGPLPLPTSGSQSGPLPLAPAGPGDGRGEARQSTALRIRLKYADRESFIEKYSVNISRGGIFIASKIPRVVGSLLRFEFQLADGQPIIRGEGAVVWVKPFDPLQPGKAHGMGVRFSRLDSASREIIDRALAWKERNSLRDAEPIAEPAPSDKTRRVSIDEVMALARAEATRTPPRNSATVVAPIPVDPMALSRADAKPKSPPVVASRPPPIPRDAVKPPARPPAPPNAPAIAPAIAIEPAPPAFAIELEADEASEEERGATGQVAPVLLAAPPPMTSLLPSPIDTSPTIDDELSVEVELGVDPDTVGAAAMVEDTPAAVQEMASVKTESLLEDSPAAETESVRDAPTIDEIGLEPAAFSRAGEGGSAITEQSVDERPLATIIPLPILLPGARTMTPALAEALRYIGDRSGRAAPSFRPLSEAANESMDRALSALGLPREQLRALASHPLPPLVSDESVGLLAELDRLCEPPRPLSLPSPEQARILIERMLGR